MTRTPLSAAAEAWNNPDESLDSIERRIHDGFPVEQLDHRADLYCNDLFARFPYMRPKDGWRAMEVGSGVGYIMQGMARRFDAQGVKNYTITGLDIAEHMLAKAKERIGGDPRYAFQHYDGVNVPLPDGSLDFIYSVAAIQHIPKVYVYNLFFEFKRLLKPDGFGVFQFLPFRDLHKQNVHTPWRHEISQQVANAPGHWHNFYTTEELENVLRDGTGFAHVDARAASVSFRTTKLNVDDQVLCQRRRFRDKVSLWLRG